MLKPQDCNQATAQEHIEFKAGEKHIDGVLAAKYVTGERVIVGAPKVSARVMRRLIDAYQMAGWTVRYECDQRDGDFLEFTAVIDAEP